MLYNILIIQAHPDNQATHFCHALEKAYAAGAETVGHTLRRIVLADMDIPFLKNRDEWQKQDAPRHLQACMEDIRWADHIVIIYPLWLGDMPARLKAFLEQVMRPGFAVPVKPTLNGGLLKGKSAHIVVTMGMPAWFYRWYFGAHSVKCLKRNILHFVGIRPVRESVVGMVEGKGTNRQKWLLRMEQLGRAGC